VSVDVVVISAGITAATLLEQAGKRWQCSTRRKSSAVRRAKPTANVTAGHRLVYKDLSKTFGDEGAHIYASRSVPRSTASQSSSTRAIDCDSLTTKTVDPAASGTTRAARPDLRGARALFAICRRLPMILREPTS
jgi:hypothetical protein